MTLHQSDTSQPAGTECATPASGSGPMIRATWNGITLAESARTIRVEGNHYFPPADVAREHLHQSGTHTRCFWKGTASYYTVEANDKTKPDAAWFYPEPSAAAAHIAGYIAFGHGVRVAPARADGAARPSVLARIFRRSQGDPDVQTP